jgi:nitrogen regulatory protein PII 2
MKEIIAIIRPKRVSATKEALVKLGFLSLTAIPVLGRGKQKGLLGEVEVELRNGLLEPNKYGAMKYIPKRYLSIVVSDEDADTVVKTIVEANQTGQIGDGKVFICPIEDAIRIRTDEQGISAIN